MCEYCESQRYIMRNDYNSLLLFEDGLLSFLSSEGDDDYRLETTINFCPMCGRNLREGK